MATTFLRGAHIQANGIRQHYLRYGGAGRKLILIPGITSPAATWGFVADRLGRRHDVYLLDVRGRGLSSTGPELDYDLDTYAADIAGFAAALDLPAFDLVGHSMGGRIAIRAARRLGQAVSRLAIVDPPMTGPGRRPYPTPLPWFLDSIRAAAQGIDIEGMRQFMGPNWTDEQLALRAEWLPSCDETAVVKTYEYFHSEDIHADLPHLALPTLLVVAGGAAVVTAEDVAECRRLLPDLAVETVAGAGHMIPWDDFDGFFAAIEPFLSPS